MYVCVCVCVCVCVRCKYLNGDPPMSTNTGYKVCVFGKAILKTSGGLHCCGVSTHASN